MKRYMIDTNIVSHFVKGHPAVDQRMASVPMASLCISAITEGELLYGLARRPKANQLRKVVEELLRGVDVLPWDSNSAERYGAVRAEMESRGKTLAALDLLIASHALATDTVLVSNDKTFRNVDGLAVEDWLY